MNKHLKNFLIFSSLAASAAAVCAVICRNKSKPVVFSPQQVSPEEQEDDLYDPLFHPIAYTDNEEEP